MQQSISIAPRFALGAEAETRLNTRCLVRSTIAIDAGLLLAFAIYVWTISTQVVQIYIALSVTKHPGGSTGGSTPSTCRSRNKFRGAGRSGLICTDPLCALAVSPSRSRPAWAGSSLGAPARALAAISSRSSAKVWIAAASGGGVAGSSRFSRSCADDLRQAGVDRYRRGGDGVSGPGGVGLQRHPGAQVGRQNRPLGGPVLRSDHLPDPRPTRPAQCAGSVDTHTQDRGRRLH